MATQIKKKKTALKGEELTINEKLDTIHSSRENKYPRQDTEIADRFNRNTSTIAHILRNHEKFKRAPNSKLKPMRVRSRPEGHIRVDKAVSRWFYIMRKRNAFINGPLIKEQALKFAEMMNIKTFQASNGWLWRWQKKENVGLKTLHEQRNNAKNSAGTSTAVEWDDSDSWLLDEHFISQVNNEETQNVQEVVDLVDVDVQDDVLPDRDEAKKALHTLFQFLYANNINARSIDDIAEHLESTSMIAGAVPPESSSMEHDTLQANSLILNPTASINESIEEPRRNDERFSRVNNHDELPDQYSVYGQHIAHRLRNCERNNYEIYTAQYDIDKIIYKLSTGNYNRKDSIENISHNLNEEQTTSSLFVECESLQQPMKQEI